MKNVKTAGAVYIQACMHVKSLNKTELCKCSKKTMYIRIV